MSRPRVRPTRYDAAEPSLECPAAQEVPRLHAHARWCLVAARVDLARRRLRPAGCRALWRFSGGVNDSNMKGHVARYSPTPKSVVYHELGKKCGAVCS